jgi:PAS domain S-box-containing protein
VPDRVREALAAVSAAAAEFAESTTNYDRLLETVARCGAQVLSATCAVSLVGSDGTSIQPVATYDEDPAIYARTQTLLSARPLNMTIHATFTPMIGTLFVPLFDLDAMRPKLSEAGVAFMADVGVHSMIAVLLRVRGESLGLLTMMRHRKDLPAFDDLDREITEHLANLAGLALANARLFGRAEVAEHALLQAGLLDAIVENIPDMVFVKEATTLSFVRFNRAGEQLLGIPREQLIGKSDNDFFPPDEARFFIDKDRETLAKRTLVDIPEEPIQTSQGERWLHTKKVPILDATGVPRFLLGISEDITDRKRDLAALREAKEQAEFSTRELQAFSYSVAHDLRAPLRAISGFGGALLEDYGDQLDEQGRNYLERIKTSVHRMGALIDALLKLSQVTREGLQVQPLDLGDLFRQAIATLQRAEPDRQLEIVVSGDLAAIGDPTLMSIVFDNLCGNAWKFTSRSPAPRIELGVEVDGSDRVYFIRDNGVGFEMKYVDKLFGVFQRLHTEREFPGTGIGLVTVQRIVQRHRGRVWGRGEVGVGATFYFTLG